MKRHVVMGVLVFVCGVLMGFAHPVQAGAISDASATQIPRESWGEAVHCSGEYRFVSVADGGSGNVCFQGEVRQIGRLGGSPRWSLVYQQGEYGHVYRILGICEGNTRCLYSDQYDTLVWQKDYHLEVYRSFSQHISFDMTAQVYRYDGTTPAQSLRGVDGSGIRTNALAVSKEGTFMVFEEREKGFWMLSVKSGEMRRVTERSHQYNIGFNPIYELAVSDDGEWLLATGLNGGASLIHTPDGCGEIDGVLADRFCQEVSYGLGELVQRFRQGRAPRFSHSDVSFQAMNRFDEVFFIRATLPNGAPVAGSDEFVALGDSFTSGEGEVDDSFYLQTSKGIHPCHRSERSYPFVVARIREWAVTSVACSGARMSDLDKNDVGSGGTQLGVVEALQPSMITIGIGGNDAGLMSKLPICAMPGECHWVQSQWRRAIADEIDRLGLRYEYVFQRLQQSAPGSEVYAVGYPLIIKEQAPCHHILGLVFTESERRLLNQSIIRVNEVMARAAAQAGVTYLDTSEALTGERLCDKTPMSMNALRLGQEFGLGDLKIVGSESFHPTPHGHERIGQQVVSQLAAPTEPPQSDVSYWSDLSQDSSVSHIQSTRLVSPSCRSDCVVTLPAATFRAHATVRVELYSEHTTLGHGVAEADGSIRATVTFPESDELSYHTLQVIGERDDESEAVYYQAVVLGGSQAQGGSEGQSLVGGDVPGDGSEVAEAQPVSSHLLAANAKIQEAMPAAGPLGTQVSSQPLDIVQERKGVSFWSAAIPLTAGIITTWLLFALWLRRLSRQGSSRESNRSDT